jgi:RNA polymerase sigma-70 factor (ECF subfamily)
MAEQRRGGDGDASSRFFTELYTEHFEFVLRSVRALGAAPDTAEDAAQDVFVVAHRRLADFQFRDTPRTWLFAIALRVMNAHRRSARRRMRLLERARSVQPEPLPTPFESTLLSESHTALRRVIAELPEVQRLVFRLSDLEGLSAPEIATRLRLNLNTVYSRLRSARREVNQRLTQLLRAAS